MLGGTNFDEALAEWALKTEKIDFKGLKKEVRDRATATLTTQVDELATVLGRAETTVQLLPGLLGEDKPRRYFVAFQNEVFKYAYYLLKY